MTSILLPLFLDSLTTPWVLVWLLLFAWLAVFSLAVYRAHLQGLLKWWHYVLFFIPVLVFLVMDVISNLTFAWGYFKDRPHELLVTQRLQRYREELPAWHKNHRAAVLLCENLNIFHPGHC